MKVDISIRGTVLQVEGMREEIAAQLDAMVRSNEKFYEVCVEVVGKYLAERVNREGQKRGILAPKAPGRGKYSTTGYNLRKRAKKGE